MQVAETPDIYSNKVLPYIQSLPASRVTWVYNMLEKRVSAAPQGHRLDFACAEHTLLLAFKLKAALQGGQ